jgi:hypothetical protein
MRQIYPPYLDFRVDKLTSSVQHVTSGEVLDIMVSLAIWLPTHVSYLLNKYDGIVSFVAKSQLIEHYRQSLGAKLFGGNRMFIDTREALVLTKQYFKQFNP